MSQYIIDVSHHQDPDDFNIQAAKDFGIVGIIARATYGTRRDKTFLEWADVAAEGDMEFGGYHFVRYSQPQPGGGRQPITDSYEWATLQAVAFEEYLKEAPNVTIEPQLDLEYNVWDEAEKTGFFISKAHRAEVWLESVAAFKHIFGRFGIYMSSFFPKMLTHGSILLTGPSRLGRALDGAKPTWWLADYGSASSPTTITSDSPRTPYTGWDLFQFKPVAGYPFYPGEIDVNIIGPKGLGHLLIEPKGDLDTVVDNPSVAEENLMQQFDELLAGNKSVENILSRLDALEKAVRLIDVKTDTGVNAYAAIDAIRKTLSEVD